jgi:hypothetical protein
VAGERRVARAERNYDRDDHHEPRVQEAFGQFLNYWNGNRDGGLNGRALDDRLTRGGPRRSGRRSGS